MRRIMCHWWIVSSSLSLVNECISTGPYVSFIKMVAYLLWGILRQTNNSYWNSECYSRSILLKIVNSILNRIFIDAHKSIPLYGIIFFEIFILKLLWSWIKFLCIMKHYFYTGYFLFLFGSWVFLIYIINKCYKIF